MRGSYGEIKRQFCSEILVGNATNPIGAEESAHIFDPSIAPSLLGLLPLKKRSPEPKWFEAPLECLN
jgi:hypothetical protein